MTDVLRGKAVAITGAGRGLGRAYALHAAGEGAAVVVNDVDREPAEDVVAEIVRAGGRAVACVGSVVDPVLADRLVRTCVDEFGALDGLVNNAAIGHHAKPWADDPAKLRALIEVNVLGALYCGTAAAAAMHPRRSGVIVNVASGSLLGQTGAAAYSASKGAIASMTASWSVDLAEHGIRVNAVCPIAWTRLMQADPRAEQIGDPEQTPDRMAPLVTYLLSDLSAALNGQLVRFVGDRLHVLRQPAVKPPVLARDTWTVADIAAAFDGELGEALEPPPAQRWRL